MQGAAATDAASAAAAATGRFSVNMVCGLGRCMSMADLKACASCKVVKYCCREHQVESFKKEGHKVVCKGRAEGTAPTFNELAAAATKYQGSGSFRMALINYGGMLELTEQTLDNPFHPQCARVLEKMAECYKQLGETQSAVEAYMRVLVILDFNNDTNDSVKNAEIFKVMGQWAECLIAVGNYDGALTACKKIEVAAVENFGNQSVQRAQALQAKGNCHVQLCQPVEAEVAYKLALQLDHCGKSMEPTEMLQASRIHYNYALLLSALGRHPDAAEHFSLSMEKKLKAAKEGPISVSEPALLESKACLEYAKKGLVCPSAQMLLVRDTSTSNPAGGVSTGAAVTTASTNAASVKIGCGKADCPCGANCGCGETCACATAAAKCTDTA